ncbi:MAG: ADP-forming succinate--CoA ligase subunit beta [Candidatus Kariarchaeaceae archaeon]|jgi:succinyl-CoA synthetase beta subunit
MTNHQMPLILEFEGKEIFEKYNIPLFDRILATSAEEAKEAAVNLGLPVIIKAQVFSGGRGKRGLIKLAMTAEEVIQHSIDILSKESDGRPVTHLLIEKGANIEREFFISMVFDMATLDLLILFSIEGGIDIETLAEEKPEAIDRINIPWGSNIYPFQFMSMLSKRGLTGSIKIKTATIIASLAKMMQNDDLQLAEINPLVVTKDGDVVAVDARVIVDDNAKDRHPERKEFLSESIRYTASEIDAKEHGLACVDLGGSIGMLSVGAGLGMATADLIEVFGGSPRNFLDVGGGASEDKVEHALRIMIKDVGLKSILINAFGGITRLDEVARGILSAIKKQNIQIPIVIRLMGTNYKEGNEILRQAGYEAYEEMEPAIEAAVKAAKGEL